MADGGHRLSDQLSESEGLGRARDSGLGDWSRSDSRAEMHDTYTHTQTHTYTRR